MATKPRTLIFLTPLFLCLPLTMNAQMMGTGMGAGVGMGSGMGQGTGMGAGSSGGQSAGFTNPEDLITATAPPFSVGDVIRMHRVGLSDIVIINELRTRYHPILLTAREKARLKAAGIDKRVRYAMEDPFGIGLAKVRAYLAAQNKLPAQPASADASRPANSPQPMEQHTASISKNNPPASAPSAASPTEASVASNAQPMTTASARASRSAAAMAKRTQPDKASAAINLMGAPYTTVPPQPVTMLVRRPSGHGIYLRHGSNWQRVDQESIYWRKLRHGYTGSVLRPGSDTATYPGGTDFLILAPNYRSALEYQLVRMKQDGPIRVFAPNPPGEVYSAGIGPDLEPFNPEQIGPSTWIVRLNDLPPGQYGFLPPVPLLMHSTTGFATTIYTFQVQ